MKFSFKLKPDPTHPWARKGLILCLEKANSYHLIMEGSFEHDVFISHSSKDEKFVCDLRDRLVTVYKLRVWLDTDKLRGGDRIGVKVKEGIRKSKTGIIVMSPDSNKSDWVDGERALMNDYRCRIIPVYYRQSDKQARSHWPSLAGIKGIPADNRSIHVVAREVHEAISEDPGAQFRSKVRMPHLLPFLIDRTEQDESVADTIKAAQTKNVFRPIVFVVQGDELSCVDEYIERLNYHLPNLLPEFCRKGATNYREAPIYRIKAEWPRINDLGELDLKLSEKIRVGINQNVTKLRSKISMTNKKALNQKLARFPAPVVAISTLVATEDFLHHGPDIITSYLDYWETWPGLLPNQRLLVFLMLEFGIPSRLRAFSKTHKLNEKIKKNLASTLGRQSRENIHLSLLPELSQIGKRDVDDWIENILSSEFRGDDALLARAMEHLDTIFTKKSKKIPLDRVVGSLISALFTK